MQATKESYDPAALRKYLVRLERALAKIEDGAPVSVALTESFSGPLLDAVLQAAKPFPEAQAHLRAVS